MIEFSTDSECYFRPRVWRAFNGGTCLSWLGYLVWVGRKREE